MKLVKVVTLNVIVGGIAAMAMVGCHSSESAIMSPGGGAAGVKKESAADERRRIEADPNMPPMAKQSALRDIERREQQLKK